MGKFGSGNAANDLGDKAMGPWKSFLFFLKGIPQ